MTDDRDARIRGHEIDLFAIARNLVDNAIRYAPDGGRVDLRVSETVDEVVLEVEDSGPGIPAAERARVLEAFYRVPGTGQIGSGLGLSIVRAVAERMKGRVELCDATAGTGLKVRVVLPKGGDDSQGSSPERP
jgi:two-component system OmpR family sensor kinase